MDAAAVRGEAAVLLDVVLDEPELGGTMTLTLAMTDDAATADEAGTADEAYAGDAGRWFCGPTSADRSRADRSAARLMLAALLRGDDRRHRPSVERVREAVCSNSYENPLKLSVALDRMFDQAGL